MRLKIMAALGLAALLGGCGENAQQVADSYKPRVDAMRAQLSQAAIRLPAQGTSVSEAVAVGSPLPVYDVTNPAATNTAFVAIEELVAETPVFDLHLQGDLSNALAWTGPNNPMAESTKSESGDHFKPQFDAALATTYAALYRTVGYAKPVATDEKTFEGGTADIEVFVIKIDGGATIAVCRVQGQSATEVSYSYKPGDDPKQKLEAFANSTLWQDVKLKLSGCLKQTTGGTFVLDAP